MEEDTEREDVDVHGFTDLDKEKLKKVREMNFDSGSILLLNKIMQNKRGGLTDEGVVIAQTIRDVLMTEGSVNDENMINLEMVEQMEVRFQYNKAAKEVLVCQKPDVAQGGTALVKTDCKHLVEETDKKFPLPDDMRVDTYALKLMVFLQTVSEFK